MIPRGKDNTQGVSGRYGDIALPKETRKQTPQRLIRQSMGRDVYTNY